MGNIHCKNCDYHIIKLERVRAEYDQALREANRIIEAYSTEHTKYLAVDTWKDKYKHLLKGE